MKRIACHIENIELNNFKEHTIDAKDYARLVLFLARKLLISPFELVKEDIDKIPKPFFMVEEGKRTRAYIFIAHNKYISIAFPLHIKIDVDKIRLFSNELNLEITNKIISEILSIIYSMNGNGAFIEAWMDSDCDDDIALALLEQLLLTEPSYLRYDEDKKASINRELKHPPIHLDINMSRLGTYKIGLYGNLSCRQFIDIMNHESDCHFLYKYIDRTLIKHFALKKTKMSHRNRKKK